MRSHHYKNSYGSSPWGPIQYVEKVMRGFSFVSTASHGGLRVSRGKAKSMLSNEARLRGIETKNYFFYEEDCKCAIPLWEIPELRLEGYTQASLHMLLSRWEPDYLIALGVNPDPEKYKAWQNQKVAEEMRAEGHPDLIVCAWRGADKTKVKTADGKIHFVVSATYNSSREPNLLSECTFAVGDHNE